MYKIPANTVFMGKNLVFVPECHSTNNLALQLCQQRATSDGTIIITSNQTAGRGQRGNTWYVEPGKNFTFSCILKPTFLAIKDQFHLNIIASIAIHDYLIEKTNETIRIKWPNDVMVNDKKIAGILIENQIQGNSFSSCVVGIGLNMNQESFIIDTAISLFQLNHQVCDLEVELESLLHKLEARYLQLKSGKQNTLLADYLNVMYRRNELHTFVSNDLSFEGTIVGLDDLGRLKISTQNGERVFGMKEIQYQSLRSVSSKTETSGDL
ncbi:MAG TPA: biotin--[acetyl-CoA-carboxylase] ligase [Chryseolinea sp.]|nr:biotin--[acetyl-CoA-carboxylase] ligase [Chryseolinea sp.]HPH46614.1 biotin--[acetyl-CoA-carboxylase] ligase [Chryseolinea sp.]HPM29426.1 biotin--[acetyl-CoA-carboxylase] ligase [Chryseolinea sp.]